MDHQFRNAAFGGFNKQDVLDYLELTSRENSQQMQALQDQLAQSQEQCRQLTEESARQAAQQEQLCQENQQLRQQAAQLQQELDGSLVQQEQLRTQLTQVQASCQALQEQVNKLLPDATAYAAVKERSAGVELDAHRRAQGVLDQAQDQAQQLHSQMEQWLGRMAREYGDLRSQVDATISHTAGELEKVGTMLEQITQCLARQDTALEQLEQAYTQRESVKVPAPMPISEE